MRNCVILIIVVFGFASVCSAFEPYLQIEFDDNSGVQFLSENGNRVRILSLTKFSKGSASIPIPSADIDWKVDFSVLRSYARPSSRAEHDDLYLDAPNLSQMSDEKFWEIMGRRRRSEYRLSGFIEFTVESRHFAFILIDGIKDNGKISKQSTFMEKHEGKWRLQSHRGLGYGNLHNSCQKFRFSAFAYFLTGETKYLADGGMSTTNIERLKVVRERMITDDGILNHASFYKYLKAVQFGVEDPDLAESVLVVYPPGLLHSLRQGIKLNSATKDMIKADLKNQAPRLASVVIEQAELGGFGQATHMLGEFSTFSYPKMLELVEGWTEANEQ